MLDFPQTIPVRDIEQTSGAYDANKIGKHSALYVGGDCFRDRIDEFLIRRPSECSTNPAGRDNYAARKRRAPYINRAGGLIDWFVASVFRIEPMFICDPALPQSSIDYWTGLNRNADGLGTPLPALARRALKEVMLNLRSYFQVIFPQQSVSPADPSSADATLDVISAIEADDWCEDGAGRLEWLRSHNVRGVEHSEFWAKSDDQVHSWTYYDEEAIAVYEAVKRHGQWADQAAVLTEYMTHEFGLPVFEIRAGHGQWVMERIADVVIALFNRDASVCKYLDDSAFQVLAISTQKQLDQIVAQDLMALSLEPGDSVRFLAPENGFYGPLSGDQDRLKQALYEVVQASAINAMATQTQNARQSAKAKQIDRDPLQVLLASFAWPVRDALERAKDQLAEFRNEAPDAIHLAGMDEFTETLADAREFITGGGMNGETEAGDDDDTDGDGDDGGED